MFSMNSTGCVNFTQEAVISEEMMGMKRWKVNRGEDGKTYQMVRALLPLEIANNFIVF